MEMNELEKEITNMAGEIRKEPLSESIVPATLSILSYHCEARGLRRGNPVFLPMFATLLLFFLFIPFFSFNPEPALNIVRLVLLFLSMMLGSVLFFKPETMAGIDRKIMGGRLSRLGPIATRSQEIFLFRVQTVYFILIAIFICKL